MIHGTVATRVDLGRECLRVTNKRPLILNVNETYQILVAMKSPRSPRPPVSPRLQVPRSPTIQSKEDRISTAIVRIPNKGLSVLNGLAHFISSAKITGLNSTSSMAVQCIDLEDNKLTIESLKTINPNICGLNLSRNPLNSCKIPAFQRLRTLALDGCGIASLAQLPVLPNLTFLSLSDNELTSYQGLRVIPSLESVVLSGNPVEFDKILTIQAFGSIRMTAFNREGLTQDELSKAFAMSPIVGHALRSGRDPMPAEDEDETRKSQLWLTSALRETLGDSMEQVPTSLSVTQPDDDEQIVSLPLSGATVTAWLMDRWSDKGDIEWVPVPGTEKTRKFTESIHIITAMRLHLIRCDFMLGNTSFSMYVDEPIGKRRKELSLPYPLTPTIIGVPVEGSTVAMTPLWAPCRVAWIRESETIAQDVETVVLSSQDVNHSIAVLLQPHLPDFPDVVFSTVFQATGLVAALLPLVTGIRFPEEIVEGETIEFTRVFTPDREGESQILVERCASPSGEWLMVAQLQPSDLRYTPTNSDCDMFLRISYTPVTDDNIVGKTVYFYAPQKVMATYPVFRNAVIGGVTKTHYPMVALADYSGGIKGACSYDWYFSKRPIDTKKGITPKMKLVAKNTQYFTPDQHMADGYIGCLMVPVRSDEVVGDPAFVATDGPIQLEDAPKPFENFDCPKVVVGKTIHFPRTVDVLLSKTTGFCGFDVLKTGTSYTPREKHIGRIARVVSDACDIMLGEVQPATPVILSVDMQVDKWVVGQTVAISIQHKHLSPDRIAIIWTKCRQGFEKVVAVDTPEYILSPKDTTFSIKVAAIAIDQQGNRLPPTYSKLSPPIQPAGLTETSIQGQLKEGREIYISCYEPVDSVVWLRSNGKRFVEIATTDSYILTVDDVGKYIRANVKLASGVVISTTSKVTVKPCGPSAEVSLPLGKIVEGQTIVPKIVYHGGVDGESVFRWYRETDDGWEMVSDLPDYTTTVEDVDRVIRLIYVPVRADRKRRRQEYQLDCGPVDPLPPSVSNVTVEQGERGSLIVSGTYKGGYEGLSFIVWRVYDKDDGEPRTLGKTMEREMVAPDELIGKLVDVVYIPVRADGLAGKPVASSNKVRVGGLPVVESAEILVKGGQLVAGCLMRCRAKVSKGATPQFQWLRGDGTAWEVIEGATDVELTTTEHEQGYMIMCSVTAVNKLGWQSRPFTTATSVHLADQKDALKISYTPPGASASDAPPKPLYTGTLLTINIPTSKLNGAHLKWQREVNGEWIDIVHGPNYTITVNDVGLRVRAHAKGRESMPTPIIGLETKAVSCSRAVVKAAQVRFTAHAKLGPTIWNVTVSRIGVTMKSKSGTEKVVKWGSVACKAIDGTLDEIMLYLDTSSKFVLIPSLADDPRLEGIVGQANVRDYVVAAVQGMIQVWQ